jgi:hypothetical protein
MISSLSQNREYPHRSNKDGTIDSVCPDCFHKIATSTWEAELECIEAAHVCEGRRSACLETHLSVPFPASRLREEAEQLIA